MSRFLAKLLLAGLLLLCPASAQFAISNSVGVECVWSASEQEQDAHVDKRQPGCFNFACQVAQPINRVAFQHPGITRFQRPPPSFLRG